MEHPQFFMGYGLQTTRLLVPNSGPNSSHLAEPPRLLLEAHGFLFIRQRHNWPRGGVVHDLFEAVFNFYGRLYIYICIKYVIIIFYTVYHTCLYIYIIQNIIIKRNIIYNMDTYDIEVQCLGVEYMFSIIYPYRM